MTKPLRRAVEVIIENIDSPMNKVLEVGSKRERGQSKLAELRDLFENADYMGVDMRAGLGVDKVMNAEKLKFSNNSFDVVMCLEVLEHAKKPWLVAAELERVLNKNGVMIVSSQQNFPIHLHPSDYFRYTPFGIASLFSKLPQKLAFSIGIPFNREVELNPQTVVMVGWKKKDKAAMNQVRKALKEAEDRISLYKPIRHRLRDSAKQISRAAFELQYKEEVSFFEID